MPHITEKTIQPYWIAHPDWYAKAPAKEIIHNLGLAKAKAFYLERETKAQSYDTMFPLDSWANPLTWIQNYLIAVERKNYEQNYIIIYDNECLAHCKQIEQLEAKAAAILGDLQRKADQLQAEIEGKVKEAKAYVETNFINPIKTELQKFQPQINDAYAAIQNVNTNAVNAFNKANSALSNASTALSSANSAQSISNTAKQAAIDAQNKVQEAFNDLRAKTEQINNLSSDAEKTAKKLSELLTEAQKQANEIISHDSKISDLYRRLSELRGQQVEPPQQGEQDPSISNFIKEFLEKL
jgi:chromosome segregation ATPase